MTAVRNLSISEIEDAIVDAIECRSVNYQGFDWPPVNAGLEHLKALAAARASGKPDPEKPTERWHRESDAQAKEQAAWQDSQMTMVPNVRRGDPRPLIALHVWTKDGRVVGLWHHYDPAFIENKKRVILAMGEGYKWEAEVFEMERKP